mmetsp:Transcript_52348/g.96902  ORF Transcript_52348/g.96902 Transcript_52348/m.96902 type:complete len:224 (-) Transcript_52348:120-791(-)
MDFQASDFASILGSLTLGIVEVGRHCNHCVWDWSTHMCLCSGLHLLKHKGADLARGVLLASCLNPCITVPSPNNLVRQVLHVLGRSWVIKSAANESLCCGNGVLWIGDSLPLRGDANQPLAIFGEGDNGWCCSGPLTVLNDLGGTALHDSHAGVGSPKVYSNNVTLDFAIAAGEHSSSSDCPWVGSLQSASPPEASQHATGSRSCQVGDRFGERHDGAFKTVG